MHFDPSSCYLIVGGLKGLCGSIATYLAINGAKNLAVMSRSGYKNEASLRVIRDVNALGAHIDLLTADVTVLSEVEAAFQQTTVPIAGIIQGAMVLRDRPFDAMTHTEYVEATACKIQGTWNLHHAAQKLHLRLDFFTLLSSISGVVGTRGQANYAAANAFLDAFAAYRRSIGERASSMDLGIVEDSGVLADNQGFVQRHFDPRVFFGINDYLLKRIFYISVVQQQQGIGDAAQLITGIMVPQSADFILARDTRFATVIRDDSTGARRAQDSTGGSSNPAARALLLILQDPAADHGSQVSAMVPVANMGLVRIMRLSEEIDENRALSLYGIDSLAAVEVRNWIRSELGTVVSTLDIINATSLKGLCGKIVDKIRGAS
jgi:NADP-dependent 3-hydroxy acid dehydrogenase YdfG/acyl carrier protein